MIKFELEELRRFDSKRNNKNNNSTNNNFGKIKNNADLDVEKDRMRDLRKRLAG
jgi:hypothetical protein